MSFKASMRAAAEEALATAPAGDLPEDTDKHDVIEEAIEDPQDEGGEEEDADDDDISVD